MDNEVDQSINLTAPLSAELTMLAYASGSSARNGHG